MKEMKKKRPRSWIAFVYVGLLVLVIPWYWPAVCWTALAQRMRYIIALFRSRQQTAALYRQPFEDQQHAAILDGKTPGGSLD